MTRDSVHKLFGPCKDFKKTKLSKNTTDDYGDFHVYYTVDNKVDAVEFFNGNITMNGKTIFPIDESNIKNIFTDIVVDKDQYTSISRSVAYTIDDSSSSSVLFGSKGYFL